MRIAHFLLGRSNPRSANGVDKTVYYLSQALAHLGHEVAIFSISDLSPVPVPGADARTYAPRRLAASRRSTSGDARPRNPFRLPEGMLDDLLAWRPEIVHFHSVHIPEAVWIARRLRVMGIPYCISPHGALLSGSQRHRRRWRKQISTALLEGRYLRDASFLHMVSGREAQELRARELGAPLVVAHNGIDLDMVPDRPDPAPLLRRFPELHGKRAVGYLGRLDTGPKGLDLLLRAWAGLPDRSRARLLLVGPDWRGGRTTLERLTIELSLTDSVLFCPPVAGDEKWSFFAGIDVFAAPSRWEAAPFTVLEAMASATPVLGTQAADPDGRIRGSDAGWIVTPDVGSLGAALTSALGSSDEELQQRGEKARRLVEREYRWADAASTLVDAYGESVKGSHRR